MKTNLKSAFILLAGVTFLFSSCERDEVTIDDDANLVSEVTADIVNGEVTSREVVTDQKIIDLVRSLKIDSGTITKGDFHFPDGTV